MVLANEFVAQEVETEFVPCLPGKQHFWLDERVKVHRHAIDYKPGVVGKIIFYIRLAKWLRLKGRAVNADAVLCFGDVFNPLVLFALWGTGNRVFISDRTSPDFRIHIIARILKRCFYPKSAGFIAQSARMAHHILVRYSGKMNVRIIPNAINLVAGQSTTRILSILYVGRLSWEKGVDRLISAFSKLKAEGWKLDIVGSGPEEACLKTLVATAGCDRRVKFHGSVADPTEFYLRSSIFVLPSHVEGFPNALCEAMSAGLPVVCFDSIPYEGIVEHGKTGCVARGGVDELVIELQRLVDEPPLRQTLGDAARHHVQRFNSKAIAREYLAFMNEGI